jgi:hypothetical protein
VKLHLQDARPPIPMTIHPTVQSVIKQCWSKNPAERPTFDEIFDILEEAEFPFFMDVDQSACKQFIDEVKAAERGLKV